MEDNKEFEVEDKIMTEIKNGNYKVDLDLVSHVLFGMLLEKGSCILDATNKYKNMPETDKKLLEHYSLEIFMGFCASILATIKGEEFIEDVINASKNHPGKYMEVKKVDEKEVKKNILDSMN